MPSPDRPAPSIEPQRDVVGAEVVLPCRDLSATSEQFCRALGFRIDAVIPAEDPRELVLSGHGLVVRLRRAEADGAARLRLGLGPGAAAEGTRTLTLPNGTLLELAPAEPDLDVPALVPELVVSSADGADAWITGRAGMRYRDLIPGRQGGRFIASHIRIPGAGPVPDYVHFHRVRFQMIFCTRGRVRVVYEDQGPPFELVPGDCVLQPPGIRHRVLESADDLEVVEVSCPALHETRADHALPLPTPHLRPERRFDGQRFVRHVAAESQSRPGPYPGSLARDTGIAAATDGLADVRVVTWPAPAARIDSEHAGELLFAYVHRGTLRLRVGDAPLRSLPEASAFVVPAGMPYAFEGVRPDLELLEVRVRG